MELLLAKFGLKIKNAQEWIFLTNFCISSIMYVPIVVLAAKCYLVAIFLFF